MKKPFTLIHLLILIVLSSCRAVEPPTIVATPSATAIQPTVAISQAIATADAPDLSNTPTPLPSTESSTADTHPNLLNYDWDDRRIFRNTLIDEEVDVLDELFEATVYHMIIQIDEPTALDGQMEVRFTNQEETDLDKIFFHRFPDQLGGSLSVTHVTVDGQAVDPEFEATSLSIPLAKPLKTGETVVVAMDFKTTIPQGESTKYNILGYEDDILALAHFYPMIATFDENGWNTEPSPPHGDETYADMSYYVVQISAPGEQVIVSSGVEIDRQVDEQDQTITVAAGPMRDFYIAMSDRFDVVSQDVGQVRINSYAPGEYLDGAELALDVTAAAVKIFNERYVPYPYSELDIVSTPTLALGIEYPGVFANALRIYDINEESSSGLPNAILLESTTAHETAHQWFYNLVGNDQLNEPWLDEALTQYATWTYFIDRYGEQNAQGYYNSLEGRWARSDFAEIPVGLPAKAYSGKDYGAIVYGRGPIFLNELAKVMGQENFDSLMRQYVEEYSWEIATTEDFKALAEERCSCDLSSLFNEWVYG